MAVTTKSRIASRRRTANGEPHPVDIHVGNRVRQRRTLLGLSQEKLGEALGLSFQQVQKYERGTNRVSASRLYEMGRVLDVPVSYFFENIDAAEVASQTSGGRGAEERPDPMNRRETLVLVQSYYGITDATLRRRMLDLIKSLRRSSEAKS
jgi:transcriptional regulator with XRE-family HTH domain